MMHTKYAVRSMALADNGRKTQALIIPCMECGDDGVVRASTSGALPTDDHAEKRLRQQGWQIVRRTTLCPKCASRKLEEVSMTNANVVDIPRADPPRSMSKDQKRKIFREVDDNWDEAKVRYAGSATDETLAAKLGVPWGWVRDVRVEAFGDNGRNEDMDKLLGNLRNLKAASDKHSAEALALAQKYEALAAECQAALAKLEKL